MPERREKPLSQESVNAQMSEASNDLQVRDINHSQ